MTAPTAKKEQVNRKLMLIRPIILWQYLGNITQRVGFAHFALILILAASCVVHYWKLEATPKWYSDESNHALWARNISNGNWTIGGRPNTNFAVGFSYGFHLLCNVSFWLFGKNLLAVRFLTATSAVACTLLLYLTIRTLGFKYGALIGAFAWNTHTLSVNFTRWGFSHGLAGTLILASLFFFLKADEQKNIRYLYWSGLAAGIAITMTYWTVPIALVMATGFIVRDYRRGLLATGMLVLPIILLTILGTILWNWAYVWRDILALAATPEIRDAVHSESTLGRTLRALVTGYSNVVGVDMYVTLGVIGLLFIKRLYRKILIVSMVLALSILPVLSGGEYLHTFFYRAITFCPLIFLGFGILCGRTIGFIGTVLSRISKLPAKPIHAIGFCIVALCLSHAYAKQVSYLAAGIRTPIDVFCADKIEDTKAAVLFLKSNHKDGYFTIASPMVAHALEYYAVLPKDVAAFNIGTGDRNKFVVDLSLSKAQFFVVDNLFYVHTLPYDSNCLELAWTIEQHNWPLVYEGGEYRIYENPLISETVDAVNVHFEFRSLKAYRVLASRAMKLNDNRAAIEILQKALKRQPRDVSLLNQLAIAHANNAEYDRALDVLDRALKVSPDDQSLMKARASISRKYQKSLAKGIER